MKTTCTTELKGLHRLKPRQQRKQQPKQHLRSMLHRSQARIVEGSIWMWQSIQVWMTHGITICSEGIMVCGSMWNLSCMVWNSGRVICKMMVFEWCSMSGGLTMWQMYMIFCIWSMRACEFINDEWLTVVLVAIYWTATIFILHCICIVFLRWLHCMYSYSSKGGMKFCWYICEL